MKIMLIAIVFCLCNQTSEAQQILDSMDAVVAAPKNHKVLFENDSIRVLEVIILPGEKENIHHHQRRSLFIVTSPARCRWYENGVINESATMPKSSDSRPYTSFVLPMNDPLHWTENIDTISFKAIRIEFKEKKKRVWQEH
jgi:hypothetical protein